MVISLEKRAHKVNNMKAVNNADWKPFQIGGARGLFKIIKGKRLTRANMRDGDINFIGSSAENNGITNRISNRANMHPGNLLTVAYNGSVGETFYQEKEFVASDDVNVLYPKFAMNKYIGLFLCPILREAGKKYVFIDKWKKEDMENDYIYLPIASDGNPDWGYMESYMQTLEKKVQKSINDLQTGGDEKTKKEDISGWKEFVVSRLFEIKSPATRSIKSYDEGDIPYVSSGSVNNGIISYLKPKNGEDLEKGRCITVSPLDGSSFYQEEDFLGRGGAGSAISLLYNENLTKLNSLFICTIIKLSAQKYSYNDALTSDNLKNLVLRLPASTNSEGSYIIDVDKKYSEDGFVPDWNGMEKYMKGISIIARDKIAELL